MAVRSWRCCHDSVISRTCRQSIVQEPRGLLVLSGLQVGTAAAVVAEGEGEGAEGRELGAAAGTQALAELALAAGSAEGELDLVLAELALAAGSAEGELDLVLCRLGPNSAVDLGPGCGARGEVWDEPPWPEPQGALPWLARGAAGWVQPAQPILQTIQSGEGIFHAALPVSYTHLRAHETPEHLVCRLLLEKKKKKYY
eukprot:TRINITY_DN6806_c0_g1_i3.p1 TRINITY_DN6806_c0_g1~~TRINITY_DN6806_c0_g1_i3.p1  ORF type:complete len:199 (+),score=44.10 TRINITY_DN6806_c0_g1_i3:337-933(+)